MIVLRMLDLQNDKNSLRVGYVKEQGVITSAYIGLDSKIDSNTKYFYYLLHFMDLIKHFYNGGGGVRQSIGYTDFRRELIILPPKPEQTAIANFIDYKIEKIDRFIIKKKQLIELLNEQKSAIINQAVTKGIPNDELGIMNDESNGELLMMNDESNGELLMMNDESNGELLMMNDESNGELLMMNDELEDDNSKFITHNSKFKKSGIEWLGDIPESWEFIKLTGVCSFVRGNSSFKKDELLSNGEYVALQYGKTYKVDEVNEKYEFYVNDEFYKVSQVVNFGDVIIISTSETIEDLGHSVFYNRSDIGLLGGEQLILKPNNKIVYEKYLYYSSKLFTKELKKYATGVKVYRFNINDLKTIYTSIPTIQEQTQIVTHIETETTKIAKIITTIAREITLVEEYKTALIAEAVTGKIDVRNYEL